MWFTLTLIAAFIGLIYVYLVWNFSYWSRRRVPGPQPTLVAGSFPQAFMQRQQLVYEVDEEYRKHRGKSPYFGFHASRTPSLMLLDPSYIKTALTTNFKHFHDNDIGIPLDKNIDPIFGRNPFQLCGNEWKEKRSDITPAFTNTKFQNIRIQLKTMYPIMQHVCKKLSTHIQDNIDKKSAVFDGKDLAARFTVDVVANCIYGIDSEALSDKPSMMLEMGRSIFNIPTKMIIYFTFVTIAPWITRFVSMPFIPKRMEEFFDKLTRDAVKMRLQSGVQRDDYLNYLMQLRQRKPMADIEMTAHTMTFFLDGFDTSSNVIALTLLQLGLNPGVQRRLRAEIEALLTQSTADVTFEQINDMEYLDQVVHECLRHTPVVGMLSKACTETIELTDYRGVPVRLEKGLNVQIPVYSIHRDAEYYPNPDQFDPDRFAAENGGVKKFKDEGVFLAFGDGPRICLGQRFGVLQVKAALVEIVRNFEVGVDAKMELPVVFDPANFLLMPRGGIWVTLGALKKAI